MNLEHQAEITRIAMSQMRLHVDASDVTTSAASADSKAVEIAGAVVSSDLASNDWLASLATVLSKIQVLVDLGDKISKVSSLSFATARSQLTYNSW